MEILYSKSYKWFLSQNQQVRIVFLGYMRYEALAKHIKPFLKNKVKVRQCSDYNFSVILLILSEITDVRRLFSPLEL